MAKTRKCALIARVSDPEQAKVKEGSNVTQIDLMNKHIEYKNSQNSSREEDAEEIWLKVDEYILEGVSGSNSLKSEQLKPLYASIEAGRINTVLCTKLDRVSRSIKDFIEFFDYLKEHDVDFVSVLQEIDTTSPYGRFISYILMAVAQLEREQTSERMKVSVRVKAGKGRFTGGSPPLGYDKGEEKGMLYVIEEEAEIVKNIFKAYVNLGSLSKVAKAMNERGSRTKYRISDAGNASGGVQFKGKSILDTLNRKAYIGIKQINIEKMKLDQNELGEMQKYAEVPARWKPIVDANLFEEAQSILEANRASGHNTVQRANHSYLLSGFLYCNKCLGKIETQSTKKKSGKQYYWYKCKNKNCEVSSTPADKMEHAVIKSISKLAFDKKLLARIIKDTNRQIESGLPRMKKELKVLKRNLTRIENKIQNHSVTYSDMDNKGKKEIKILIEELSENKTEIEKRINRLEKRIDLRYKEQVHIDSVVWALDEFTKSVKLLNKNKQKKLLGTVVNRVYWDGKNGLRIGIYGNQPLTESSTLTGNSKFAERYGWRLDEDLNLGPSG